LHQSLSDDASGTATDFYGSATVAPFLSVSATLGAGPLNAAVDEVDSVATLDCGFQVLGAPGQTGTATVLLSAQGAVSRSSSTVLGEGLGIIGLTDSTGSLFYSNRAGVSCELPAPNICGSGGIPSFSVLSQPLTVKLGSVVTVSLFASATMQHFTGTFVASVDPTIVLALGQAGLSLKFSDGIVEPGVVVPGCRNQPQSHCCSLAVASWGHEGIKRGHKYRRHLMCRREGVTREGRPLSHSWQISQR
jgi:hypothetical protein